MSIIIIVQWEGVQSHSCRQFSNLAAIEEDGLLQQDTFAIFFNIIILVIIIINIITIIIIIIILKLQTLYKGDNFVFNDLINYSSRYLIDYFMNYLINYADKLIILIGHLNLWGFDKGGNFFRGAIICLCKLSDWNL